MKTYITQEEKDVDYYSIKADNIYANNIMIAKTQTKNINATDIANIKAKTISSVAEKTKNINFRDVKESILTVNFRDVIKESILAGDIDAHGIIAQAINPDFKDFETPYDRLIRNKRKKESDYCMC